METVKPSKYLLWSIARGAFVVAMHRTEDKSITWANPRFLAENSFLKWQCSMDLSHYLQNNTSKSTLNPLTRGLNAVDMPSGTRPCQLKWNHVFQTCMPLLL